MDPHVFCGPEFVLEVPAHSIGDVLERIGGAKHDSSSSVGEAPPGASIPADGDRANSGASSSSSLGWTVQPAALHRIQSEIYGVCSAEVRRQVHAQLALKECIASDAHKAMTMVSRRMAHFGRIQLPAGYTGAGSATGSSSGVGTVPPPPATVAFVEARSSNSLNSEEVSSVQQSARVAAAAAATPNSTSAAAPTYLILCITDSRVAAQLHMLCLRNTFLALPSSCRLLNYYVFGGRAAGVVPSQILQKRELLKTHLNFDQELWSLLETKLTDDLVRDVRAAGSAHVNHGSSGRLLTAFEQHEQDVGAVLHFCEEKVRYAGVFDDDEEASPFLIAMGLCWRLGLTMDDVCRHFARHPRRVIRALALYLARYTLAPEDYVYFFMPSLTDEVIIACTEDAQVTYSMKDLSRQLLTKNEIVDAWLPILSKYWQDEVVAPSMAFMAACWRLQGQGGSDAASEAGSTAAAASSSLLFNESDGTKGAEEDGTTSVRGVGRGVAAQYGFRSIAEIAEQALQHARVLVPQSMATILKRRRGVEEEVFGTARGGDADALDGDGDDDDDFLINVEVQGDDEDEGGGAAASDRSGLAFPTAKRSRTEQVSGTAASASAASSGPLLDPHRRIMREGLKLTLSLLGRHTLFRANDEHYIEF